MRRVTLVANREGRPASCVTRKALWGYLAGAKQRKRDLAGGRAYQRAYQQMVVATAWHPRYFGADRNEYHRFLADSCRQLVRG